MILTDGSDKWLAGFGALSHMESTSCVPEKVGFSVSNTVLILWETYLHYCLSTFLWCSGLQQRKPATAKLLESFGTVLIPNLGISMRSPDSTERGNTKWVCKPIFDIAYWCKWRYKQKLMDLGRCRAEFCLSSLSLMLLLWDSVCTEWNLFPPNVQKTSGQNIEWVIPTWRDHTWCGAHCRSPSCQTHGGKSMTFLTVYDQKPLIDWSNWCDAHIYLCQFQMLLLFHLN